MTSHDLGCWLRKFDRVWSLITAFLTIMFKGEIESDLIEIFSMPEMFPLTKSNLIVYSEISLNTVGK